MDQSQRYRNFFSNVSHIKIGENVESETIKAIAIAAKSVENKNVGVLNVPDRYVNEVYYNNQ